IDDRRDALPLELRQLRQRRLPATAEFRVDLEKILNPRRLLRQHRDRRRTDRSEEHTSELQSPCNLVCRLLLEKKKSTSRSHSRRRVWSCRSRAGRAGNGEGQPRSSYG